MEYFGQVAPFLYARITSFHQLHKVVIKIKWHVIGQMHSSLAGKGNVDSPKDAEFKFCSKAEVPGIEGLDSRRRVSGGGTAKELDLLSPESPGPS